MGVQGQKEKGRRGLWHLGFSLLPHQEERVLSGALEASKALLEEQLEAAQERCARLHETQRENLLLRTRLGEAHAVRLTERSLVTLKSVSPSDPSGPPGFRSDPVAPSLLLVTL